MGRHLLPNFMSFRNLILALIFALGDIFGSALGGSMFYRAPELGILLAEHLSELIFWRNVLILLLVESDCERTAVAIDGENLVNEGVFIVDLGGHGRGGVEGDAEPGADKFCLLVFHEINKLPGLLPNTHFLIPPICRRPSQSIIYHSIITPAHVPKFPRRRQEEIHRLP